ncbi:glycosyltransferase [Hymenobacter puniceus]|uniref:glycosyltransferase n=1 Tax=Hymenobacter sp. BT190 TaxID=2763505 RepID=UPI0016510205|nr:glycosyltransferase [Hymenobacter sp. BT190]MBC6697799.1 glycosyltransferase [Hymenobacter sp. BT190]
MRSVVVYVYNSCDDPLFKGNLLLLLMHAGEKQPDLRLHLITYEQVEYGLTPVQQAQRHEHFARFNIVWYPLQWHSGRFKLLKKAYDLLAGALIVLRLKLKFGVRSIVSLGTVSGSFAFLLAKLFTLKYYVYQYEPHSEFMRDCNIWPETSLAFRGLHYMERVSGMKADILSTGTTHMINRMKQWGTLAEMYKLPSCVDEAKLHFRPEGRARIRAKHAIAADKPVILYLGKFGGIYYNHEIAVLFRAFQTLNSDLFFLIVSPDAPDRIDALMQAEGLLKGSYTVTRSPYEQVQDYISAADFGIVAVPPLPSQKFRSPIKVGEYLCCGLPYLVCAGVSEDDVVAKQFGVGVVVKDFSEAEAVRVYPQVDKFLNREKTQLRHQCREAGIAYRGLSQYLDTATQIFAQL